MMEQQILCGLKQEEFIPKDKDIHSIKLNFKNTSSFTFKSSFYPQFADHRPNDYFSSFQQPLKPLGTLAHSGSFFYVTHDELYLIKTVKKTEYNFLKNKFLKQYFQYLPKNPNTKILKVFGLYKIKEKKKKTKHFVVTEYIKATEKYDLKASGLLHKWDTTDLIKFQQLPKPITAPAGLKDNFTQDLEFCSSLNINDYSLLVCVQSDEENDCRWIDMWSEWNWKRKIGTYFLPGVYFYFPRFMPPFTYAKRMTKTVELVLRK